MLEPVYDDEEAAPKHRKPLLALQVAVTIGLAIVILSGLVVIIANVGTEAVGRLIAITAVILGPAILAGSLAKDRPIGARGGFYLGLFLSVLGVIIVLVLPVKEQRAPRPAMKECPYCAERVRVKARVCRFCDRNIA